MSTYIWVDGTWTVKNGGPMVVLFLRETESKELYRLGVQGFRPYFWVPCEMDDSNVIPEAVSADGVPVQRVYTRLPSDVPHERVKYPRTWEADVLFDMRFVIDKGIRYGCEVDGCNLVPTDVDLQLPRFHYFDIEVSAPRDQVLEVAKAKYPVVSIATWDSFTQRARAFVLCDYPSERAMLQAWVQYVSATDPDVLTAWFGGDQIRRTGFDFPYLYFRSRRLGIKLPSRLGTAGPYHCPGRQLVDMMAVFKQWSKPMGEREGYGLKSIAKAVTGFEYEDMGGRIEELVRRGEWDVLREYCENDVTAMVKIAEETRLWWAFEALRRLAGVKLVDTLSRQRMIEVLMMRNGSGPLPTREKRVKKKYTGAYVHPPPKGVHENVAVYDYASLYPSIILAYGVSPDVQGVFPKVIRMLLAEREKLRKKRLEGKATWADEVTEVGLKFSVNAFYGVLGSKSFRMYNPELAGFITAKGQELVKMVGATLQDRWLAGDTDSVFIRVKDLEEAKALEGEINGKIEQWAEDQGVEFSSRVKFEKFYRRLLFKAKKRYVGWLVWKDGREVDKIDFVGMEIRRSDASKLTKELLAKFAEMVLRRGEVEQAVEMVKRVLVEVLEGKRKPTEVAVPRGLHKTEYKVHNPWLEGVKNARVLLGRALDPFGKPRLLYCVKPVRELCIDEEVTDEELERVGVEVDWKKAAEVCVLKKFEELVKIVSG